MFGILADTLNTAVHGARWRKPDRPADWRLRNELRRNAYVQFKELGD